MPRDLPRIRVSFTHCACPDRFGSLAIKIYPPSFFSRAQEDAYRGTCRVSGSLPAWLRGSLFRTGPGLWEVGSRQLKHATDG